MSTVFVWMLLMTSIGGSGQVTRTIIDNIPTAQECQRVASTIKNTTEHKGGDDFMCVQYQKLIIKESK